MKEIQSITSRNNPKILSAVALLKASARKKEGKTLLEGARLVADAASNGYPIETLFFTAEAREKYSPYLETAANAAKERYEIADHVAQKLKDTASPQGIWAVIGVSRENPPVDENGFYVMTDGVQNPENLGALSRTAEAFGASGLFVRGGADPFSGKALRASMGALLRLPVYEVPSPEDLLCSLRAKGMRVFGAVLDPGAKDVRSVDKRGGKVLVVGSEGAGVSSEVVSLCTDKVVIPMSGRAESLNAAAAAAILIWEFVR